MLVKLKPQEILDLPMDKEENDAQASSVRGYLKTLLKTLWEEGEGFSGKRPLGNSCWQHELYIPLVRAKVIPGSFDGDGFLQTCDDKGGDRIITEAIEAL